MDGRESLVAGVEDGADGEDAGVPAADPRNLEMYQLLLRIKLFVFDDRHIGISIKHTL